MKMLILALATISSLTAHAASRFDHVTGRRKIVCDPYFPSGLGSVYVQSPEANGHPIPGATFTVAYRKSFTETVYLGMTKETEDALRELGGPSRLTVVDDAENTDANFRADLTLEAGTYKMLCQPIPEKVAAPL